MTLFARLEREIADVVTQLAQADFLSLTAERLAELIPRITLEPPRDPSHGDLATNAALILAKPAGRPPRELAATLAEHLKDHPDIEKAEVAGPGFLNLTLAPKAWQGVIREILAAGPDYGRSDLGAGKKVNVEFVSANPTGPMHVGHCRGAVFGDALARLLAYTGHDVTREYYINDAGAQVDVLARSAYLRYREALGEDIGEIPEGLYPGDYLKPVGAALAEAHGRALLDQPEETWLPIVRDAAIDAMMAQIREDLAALHIHHDVFFSERTLHAPGDSGKSRIAELIDWLRERGLVYEGRLPPPKGKPAPDWEDREQLLFRATQFGDDVDRPLVKSDGSYTYFAADMAYHYDKFRRGFLTMIDVWGADHGGYVTRMKGAVAAVTEGKGELDVKICQLVKLLRGGEPVKMSKRAGSFVTLRDVVDEVGVDPVRFMMLYRKNDAPLDFDFEKVQEQSRDNPVFYVQYAHARAHSVLYRKLPDIFPDLAISSITEGDVALERLVDPGELAIMKRLAQYPRMIASAATAHEPHRIAFYLYDLASDLHAQWNRGTDKPQLRFIREDDRALTEARLALLSATATVIANGLDLLGVQAVEEMR